MRFILLAALLSIGLVAGCITYRNTYDLTSVQGLAVDPLDPNTVLAVHGSRIERSTDGGRTWKVAASPNAVSALAWVGSLAWTIGEPVGSAQLTVLASADTGLTWSATVSSLPSSAPVSYGSTLDVDHTDDRHVVVAISGNLPQVFVTSDAGGTWSTSSLAPVPSYTSPVVAAFDGADGSSVWLGFPHELLHSSDGGLTFAGIATVISGAVLDIAALGSSVLVATDAGLLGSTDGGTTFTPRFLPSGDSARSVRIDGANPSIVWVVGYSGVYRSADGGATFLLVANGGTTGPSIAIAPSNDRIVLFGGESTLDGGATFVRFGVFDFGVLVPLY